MLFTTIDALAARAASAFVRVGAVVLVAMMGLTFFDVLGRYLFNRPIVGTVETTELLMGSIVFLGIGLTTLKGGHISVDLVTAQLGEAGRRALALVAQITSLVIVELICWRMWVIAAETVDNNLRTQLWESPVWPAAYVMAVGASLMAVAIILQLVRALGELLARSPR